MSKSRFTRTQILGILKQKEAGTPVRKLCCEHDISHAAIYTWHKRHLKDQAEPVNAMTGRDGVLAADPPGGAALPVATPNPSSEVSRTPSHCALR